MKSSKMINEVEYRLVFAPYIRKNGKVIYPKTAKAFCFWVKA